MEAFSENYKCIFGREYNNASPSSHLFWWLKMRMWIHLFCIWIWTMFNVSVCVVYGGILLLIIPYFTISCHLSVWPEAEAEEDNKINAPKILRAGNVQTGIWSYVGIWETYLKNHPLDSHIKLLFSWTFEIRIIDWLFDPTKKTVKLIEILRSKF